MTEHAIKIYRDGKSVFVRIPTDISSDGGYFYLDFKCERNSNFNAELLTRYLRKRHADRIIGIRKAEFSSGWKHAKAKKHGRKWFTWFNRNMDLAPSCD